MGYEIACLISEIDDEFLCSICTMVLENPMQLPCEHAFCNDCIKGWIEIGKTSCPVESCLLALAEIKPTPRYFRKLLGKLEMKCKFEPKGCQAVVKIDHLQDHLTKCVFNPSAEVICDKGCNIKITRGEYEAANCFSHLANQQREHFDKITRRQNEEITKLNDELKVVRCQVTNSENLIELQREEINKLNDKIMKLSEEVGGQQKDCTNVTEAGSVEQEQIMKLNEASRSATPIWQYIKNMKYSNGRPHVLEYDGSVNCALATLSSSMNPANAVFKMKLLTVGQTFGIGLTTNSHSNDKSNCYFTITFAYANNIIHQLNLPQLKNGDIVECGIKFPDNFVNDGITNVEVYFAINEEIVFNQEVVMPLDGFFPSVFVWPCKDSVPKVEFLH